MPRRSRLYSLEPIGIGTPFVESLSGYLARLADAHAVSVSNLAGRELSDMLHHPLVRPLESVGFHPRFYAMNGLGERAVKWTEALQLATMRTDLRFLTLLPFKNLFWEPANFRRCRAWCSACYQDDQVRSHPSYDRLLWSLKVVTSCHRHQKALKQICPHCHRRAKPITVYSRPGYCSNCQNWLGESTPDNDSSRLKTQPPDEMWYAEQAGALLSASPQLGSDLLSSAFTTNFRACVDCITEGNKSAFADIAHVHLETVQSLYCGATKPQISTLLRISYHLQIPVLSLLESNLDVARECWRKARGRIESTRLGSRRTLGQIRKELQKAAVEQPPSRLSDVARRLSYIKLDRLYRADAKLCRQIADNYQDSIRGPRQHPWDKRFCSPAQMRSALEASLAQELPISPYHVALELGFVGDRTLRRKFPDLCRAIQDKIDQHKILRTAVMKRAIESALTEVPPPTLGKLCERIGCSRPVVIRRYFPAECNHLLERHRQYRCQKIANLREQLQALSRESPAVSLEQACKRVELSRQRLVTLCPDESAAIVAHFEQSCREGAQQRVNELHYQTRQIVADLHREGKCPSFKRVRSLLRKSDKPVFQGWQEMAIAINAAKNELKAKSQTLSN